MFPRNPDGSLTDKIAHTLFNVLRACDMHVDFRGGDLPESHLTHTIQLRVGDPIDETTGEMARVFGLETLLRIGQPIGWWLRHNVHAPKIRTPTRALMR